MATTDDLTIIEEAVTQGFEFPSLAWYQHINNPVVRRFFAKLLQPVPCVRRRVVLQLQLLHAAARIGACCDLAAEKSHPDKVIQHRMRQLYEETRERLAPYFSTEDAGKRFAVLVQQGLNRRKEAMRKTYAEAGKLAAEERLVFDLSASIEVARQQRAGDPPLSEEEAVLINDCCAAPISAEAVQNILSILKRPLLIGRINACLSQLRPMQCDYQFLKEIRTRVGDLLGIRSPDLFVDDREQYELKDHDFRFYDEFVDRNDASSLSPNLTDSRLENPFKKASPEQHELEREKKRLEKLYQQLSEDMTNPVNEAPGFAKAIRNAIDAERRYYNAFNHQLVRIILASTARQDPVRLFWALVEDPACIDPPFLEIIQTGDSEVLSEIQADLEKAIMLADDALKTLQIWERESPDAYRWLFPTPEEQAAAKSKASDINALESGTAKEAYEAYDIRVGFAIRTLERQSKNPFPRTYAPDASERMSRLVQLMGYAERDALCQAVYYDALKKAVQYHANFEVRSVDPEALSEQIEKIKEQGWWQGVLTGNNSPWKLLLEGLLAASKRIW